MHTGLYCMPAFALRCIWPCHRFICSTRRRRFWRHLAILLPSTLGPCCTPPFHVRKINDHNLGCIMRRRVRASRILSLSLPRRLEWASWLSMCEQNNAYILTMFTRANGVGTLLFFSLLHTHTQTHTCVCWHCSSKPFLSWNFGAPSAFEWHIYWCH